MQLGDLVLPLVLTTTGPATPKAETSSYQHIRLERRVTNLEYAAFKLRPRAGDKPLPGEGTIYTGRIIRRLPGDGPGNATHYVHFAVLYQGGLAVQAWCDLNGNHEFTDDPELDLLGHPTSPKARAFLVDLRWTARSGWRSISIDRKIRVILEPELQGEYPTAHEQVVFGMVGEMSLAGSVRDIVLFDGNGDGIYSKDFGDGFFVDRNGDHHLVVDRMSPDFGPFAVPFQMGDRRYEVVMVDPEGRFLGLLDLGPAIPTEPPAIRKPAPDFEYRLTTGRVGRLSDHRGAYVALYFWASWCGTCAVQAPALVDLEARYRTRGVRLLGVSFDTDREAMERFRTTHGETWPTTFSGRLLWEDPIARLYRADAPGSLYLIDPHGRLDGIYQSPVDLESRLKNALQPDLEPPHPP